MLSSNPIRGAAVGWSSRVAAGVALAAMVVTLLAGPAAAQRILAEGDVAINRNPAGGELGSSLNVTLVDVGVKLGATDDFPAVGRLLVEGGADLTVSQSLTAGGGFDPNAYGLIEAAGFGTTVSAGGLSLGSSGDGRLIVRDGAAVAVESSALFGSSQNTFNPGRGDLQIQGFGSVLHIDSLAELNFGNGQVLDGGRLLVDSKVNIGTNDTGYDLTLDNGGRFQTSQNVTIGSSSISNQPQSRVTIGVGSEFAADTALIYNGGSIQLNGGLIRSDFVTIVGDLTGYGEMIGSVRISANINETTAGRLSVAAGRELSIRRGSQQTIPLGNDGRIENNGTLTLGDGQFNNDFTGRYLGRNSTVRARLIENRGQIDLVEGFNQIDAELENFETENFEGPRVTVSGNATALFTGDVNNNGQIRVEAGSTATFTQNVSGSGSFDGTGQVVFLGGFTPGNSPGLVTFGGDLVLGSSLASEFEIGGDQRGTEYDAVNVAGELQLGGTLRTILTTGVSAGDAFTLFDAQGGVTGTFDNVEFEGPLPSTLSLEVIYTATQVQLGIIGPSLLGDYNGNGFVDAADYTVWQDNFNSTTNLAADGNGDGVINAADYTVWQDNFGESLDSVGTLTTIPEPGTLGITAVGLALLLRRRQI